MGLIFVLFGLSTMWLFMFRIEWLLNFHSFLLNLIYDVFLFGIAFLLIDYSFFDEKYLVALKMPLVSSIMFFVMLQMFKRVKGRNPENTFWTFSRKPLSDVIFTILFWFLGVGLPFFIV